MPPKKSSAPAPKGKTEEKKKAKVVEDKTFGMKNKKGAQTQKVIEQMKKQVAGTAKAARATTEPQKSKKELEKEKLEALAAIGFKPVAQTVGSKVDPKSVLCMFFKQGLCTKGDKCKFSHDLSVESKAEKRSLYVDERDPGEDDDMANWDEQKLEEVVQQKHGEAEKAKLKTTIICKHFLQAVEDNKYGWFWACPNGNDKCLYRHALPPDYVLSKDRKKKDEEKITLEELIERERASLGNDLTKVTWQSFRSWKERKRKENAEREKAELEKKKTDFQTGRSGGLSGRELFAFNPALVTGDDDMEAADSSAYVREFNEAEADIVVKEWTKEALEYEGDNDGADDTGATISTTSKREGAPYGRSDDVAAAPAGRRMPRDQTADYREAVRNGNADAASDDDADDSETDEDDDEDYERVNLDEVDVEFFENEPEEAIMQAMEELAECDDDDQEVD